MAMSSKEIFTMLNSDVMNDRSIALAKRLQEERNTTEARIDRAFRLVFGRHASPAEKQQLTTYVKDMQDYHHQVKPEPVSYPTEITRSLVEEFSGRPFEYQEILPIFERYQPDSKPADVSAETRALADLCLLLLNTNEFMYVE